ncbi:MAG TPA: NAD-dependent epimerase/dehydratase family protein [Longimicrobiales bacterium]
MAGSLFVTGASGFLGRHFLSYCEQNWDGPVVCLSRQPPPPTGRARWIGGDVLEPAGYAHELGPDTTIVHLAAVTGKADRGVYEQINAEGTRRLLQAAANRKIRRFVLVSSVAARYPNLDGYPYGASKRDAEQAVAKSGIPFLIVRPTIVLGKESPIWQKLRQLAVAPIVPMIGSGRTRVQPIHVQDVASALCELVNDPSVAGTIELAGAESLSIRELLERIRASIRGARAWVLPIPYAPLRMTLELMERTVPGLAPITAGQLSLFVCDSSVVPNETLQALWPGMMNVEQMIRASENGRAD